ncbi:MAG: hypothetical protein KDE57_16140 [Calditrichaeota bacterium]|nr:hypothetical protein [Calditrichota bacterium]
MRTVISLLLLFLLFQPSAYVAFFKLQQHHIRKEIKQKIKRGVPDDELVLLKIAKNSDIASDNFFRLMFENEIRLDGNMYDIVRQEDRGDTTWYFCIHDDKETGLFANLDDWVKREFDKNSDRKSNNDRRLQSLSLWFFGQTGDDRAIKPHFSIAEHPYVFRSKTWFSQPSPPPPQS